MHCNEKGCKIEGIKCDVKNCVHHTADNCCDAGKIEVGPMSASSSKDTVCTTFEAK